MWKHKSIRELPTEKACAACINNGSVPPSLVALVLHFLEAPEPNRCSDLERTLALTTLAGQASGFAPSPSKAKEGGTPPSSDTYDICSFNDIEVDFQDSAFAETADFDSRTVQAEGGGLVLRFRLSDASERLVDFGRQLPPLGMDFHRSVSLQVSRSFMMAEALGVRVGWVLIAVNGTKVETWQPVEAFRLMKAVAQGYCINVKQQWQVQPEACGIPVAAARCLEGESGRPPDSSRPPRVFVAFVLPNGSSRLVDFGHHRPPLGMTLTGDEPITVRAVQAGSPAQVLGVQPGWVVRTVNQQPADNRASFQVACRNLSAPAA